MKRIFTGLLSLIFCFLSLSAQNNTDKEISKILRDTKNYISSEVRASSEDEAYEEALNQLMDKVTDYYRGLDGNSMPESVYLSNVSSRFDRLTTHNSDNRYRVLVYVKKSDLLPMGSGSNSMILAKNDDNSYSMINTETPEPMVITVTDTIVEVVEREVPIQKSVPRQVSKIAGVSTEQEINETLIQMRKSNDISGAAAFPIGNYGDFYVVVINPSGAVETILYFDGTNWSDAVTNTKANPNSYRNCKAYWFTLP